MLDDELFLARRLGYGLRLGESIGPDPKSWALSQLSNAPPLDFYGPNGTNLRDRFPDFAEPTVTDADAATIWGNAERREIELFAKADEYDGREFENLLNAEVNFLRGDYPDWRDCVVTTLTAVNGPQPVFERFWRFWINHFTVAPDINGKVFYGPHIRGLRAAMTGTFRDVLNAGILSSAMLRYLDNWLSTGPNSEIGKGTNETINENLARELLELHTISPAAGYTQDDVREVAYLLSGWGVNSGAPNEHKAYKKLPRGTAFLIQRHEPGDRTVMGKKYAAKGKGAQKGANQVAELLDDLAADPRTARFISQKLVRHFVADVPPPDSVANVEKAWLASGGNMQSIHAAVIDEVIARGRETPKFTTPQNWLIEAHRLTGLDLPNAQPWGSAYWLNLLLAELGQSFSSCPQPNGWSDLEVDWVSRELMVRRVGYAFNVGVKAIKNPDLASGMFDYAARLAGDDSALVDKMKSAATPAMSVATLLCSPEFMRV